MSVGCQCVVESRIHSNQVVTAAVSTQINRIKKPIKKYSETLHYHACNCICHWYKLIDDDYGELGCSRLILTKDKKHQRMIGIDYINVRENRRGNQGWTIQRHW